VGRGFIIEQDGWLVATQAGRDYYETTIRKRRRTASGFDSTAAGARAEVLQRHVDGLEGVLPPDIELMVGDIPCAADDILAALRAYARTFERRAPVPAG
jgi:hypothetical protein